MKLNHARVVSGVCEAIRENNYKLVDATFGSRFPYDRRFRIHALCGTNYDTYGKVGAFEFMIYRCVGKVGKRYYTKWYDIMPCYKHLEASTNGMVRLYTDDYYKYKGNYYESI